MKTVLITLILSLGIFSVGYLSAQNCPNGALVLNSQADVDNFAINFPECESIDGNVIINSISVVSLAGLDALESIGGNLIISNSGLTDLSGLDNLESIGGNLFIDFNSDLEDLEGLGSLENLDGFLSISYNESLISFAGINNFESFGGGGVQVIENINLESLAGINYPSTIPSLQLFNNGKVTKLDPLIGVDTISGEIEIQEMHGLKDFSGLDSLKYVEGNFYVNRNDSLIDFSGLENLTQIDGNFTVINHKNLLDFTGFDQLLSINGRVEVMNNVRLINFSGFESLRKIEASSVLISENDSLLNLIGLEELDSIIANFEVSLNPFLRAVQGLNSLDYVKQLKISNNDSLRSFAAFSNLKTIEGSLIIDNNNALQNLGGFNLVDPNFITSLIIKNNLSLTECQATAICNYLDINVIPESNISNNAGGCNAPTEVEVLCATAPLPVEFVRFAGESVDKQHHLFWSTASEYNNEGFYLERAADGLDWRPIGFVAGQGQTEVLTHYQFIDEQPLGGENYYRLRQVDFDGQYHYSEVILLRLETSVPDLTVFPNPTNGAISIFANNLDAGPKSITIRDPLGKLILVERLENQQSWQLSTSLNSRGIYVVSLQSGNNIYREKVICTGQQ